MKTDIGKIRLEAEKEIQEEREKAAKERIKVLLRKRDAAAQVFTNIERELADAYAELGTESKVTPILPSN